MMDMIIKWQDTRMTGPNWFDLPVSDIECMTVAHCVALLSGKIPVVVKEGAQYLVNTADLLASYSRKGSKVMMIQDVEQIRMDQILSKAGFVS